MASVKYVDEAPLTHKALSYLTVEEILHGIDFYELRGKWSAGDICANRDGKQSR